MKNEDKIVELLAETLRRQDQHEEILGKQMAILEKQMAILEKQGMQLEKQGMRLEKQGMQLEKHGDLLEKQGTLLEKFVQGQELMVREIIGLRSDFAKMNDHLLTRFDKVEGRPARLEDKFFDRKD